MTRRKSVAGRPLETRKRLRFETLLSDLIARFVNLPPDQVDAAIEEAQRRFCEELGLDRSSLWQPEADDPGVVSVTHLYQPGSASAGRHPGDVGPPQGVPLLEGGRQALPSYKRIEVKAAFPWVFERCLRGETVAISSLAGLPEGAERDRASFEQYGTRSTVVVPLLAGGRWLGLLSFATLREERAWPEALVKRFQLVAQVFANALAQAKADARIAHLRAELGRATRVSLLGELTATLAHEVNRPLAAILSNAQAARRWLAAGAPDLSELRDVLDDIIADDKRAGQVIHRIHAMLQRDPGPREAVDLNQICRDVAALLGDELQSAEVQLRLELAQTVPSVEASPVEMQQVVLNLVVNAIQSLRGSGAPERLITVATRREGRELAVLVKDTGPGLCEEARGRLWEPFFTTKPGGLGMGLAICRRIAEAHGGHVEGENNPEGGATFRFALPAGGPP
jgi:signal transduction histidine kinase